MRNYGSIAKGYGYNVSVIDLRMDLIKQDCLETLHANSDDNGQVDLFNALVSLMTNYMGYAANFGALAAIKVLDQVGAIHLELDD